MIRLEIGALAAWTPAEEKPITPYAAEQYGRLFKQPSTEILTVLPKRTFWEKVTILHREAYRPENSALPTRYSRHYYDLYCMANSPVKAEAFADLDLLDKVVRFKDKFYRCSWAKIRRSQTRYYEIDSFREKYQNSERRLRTHEKYDLRLIKPEL